jgi:O-antigen/teichoic acid export membrane protein
VIAHLTPGRIAELAVAVLLLGAGIWFYQRRDKSDTYGAQGAVILLVVGAIVAIHGLGLLRYHPSNAEAEMMKEQSR